MSAIRQSTTTWARVETTIMVCDTYVGMCVSLCCKWSCFLCLKWCLAFQLCYLIYYFGESSETQKALQILNESTICEVPWEAPTRSKHYKSSAGIRILSAMERKALKHRKLYRSTAEMWISSAMEKLQNTENTTDPQRICKLWVPGKSTKHRKHYRSAAEIWMMNARE